ncbi:MAG TPA: glycosyltransferase family 39 protein [Verrucomicrobiae bacterium]|nr:glycosyltransferase family 39 protein [Verrucomicrobiae bacterium]
MPRAIKKDTRRPQSPPAATPRTSEKISHFLERYALLLAILLIAVGSARIIATYTVFNHTVDEPGHIASGMEWLERGTYTFDTQHPPLSRIAAAIGPYLSGCRLQGTPKPDDLWSLWAQGAKVLYYGHNYDHNLAVSRLGILPFFWIACLAVYGWGARYFSRAIGVIALFCFSFTPSILAHAGFSTTDMALTAFLALSFLTGLIWVEQPTLRHAVWFGIATGLMVLSKYSCLAFFPVVVALVLVWYVLSRRPGFASLLRQARDRAPSFALAVAISVVLISAGFRFSLGPLFRGIHDVQSHMEHGHLSYLLGETRYTGFWDFYFVSIFFKTPIGLLALLTIGLWLLFRKYPPARNLWIPLLFCAGILLVGMTSPINIGIRHVLPVYVGFSLIAAVAVARLLELGQSKKWVWAVLSGLTLWFAVSSVLAHPDYVAYFNEMAGSEPEKILVDSDLDWGQDMKRLSARLKELHVTQINWLSSEYADFEGQHGFPRVTSALRSPNAPLPGWNAIGVNSWKMGFVTWPNYFQPKERVGKSILLWYFPPAGQALPEIHY